MDKAFGSTKLFSLRRGQDVQLQPDPKSQVAPSPDTALALGNDLHVAARRGDLEAAVELLRKGADPNTTSQELRATPLHTAAMLGRNIWSDKPVYGADTALRLMRELLLWGAQVNAVDQYGYSALHLAAATGYVDMVSLLLHNGADPSVQDFELLFTPLHVATSNGQMDAALLLIEAGADTARTDYTGRSAWQVFAAASEAGPPAAAATSGPAFMLQLLLTGLRDGRAIPVSALSNLVMEIAGDSAGKAESGATSKAILPVSATTHPDAIPSFDAGDNDDDDDSSACGPAGPLVRQLVGIIRDLGQLSGCWQLLEEAVRGGSVEMASLVLRAVMALHPGSLADAPWGGALVNLLACMPDVFDQMVLKLRLVPPEHMTAAVRRLHPSLLDPSNRLLLYRRLVGVLQRSVRGGGGGGTEGTPWVARAFLQELPSDTVADLAVTPFFKDFTELLPAAVAPCVASGSDTSCEVADADAAVSPPAPPAASTLAADGMRSLVLASSSCTGGGAQQDTFAVTNLLQGAMQSGSLLAVDNVVQAVLRWQQAANACGRRALLLGLNAHLLDWLATAFPTSCRALMQMPRQLGPLVQVRLPRPSAGRHDDLQLFRCSATAAHHLVWWPRLTRALTTGPSAVGDRPQVEALLAAGLPLESLFVVVAGREALRRREEGEGEEEEEGEAEGPEETRLGEEAAGDHGRGGGGGGGKAAEVVTVAAEAVTVAAEAVTVAARVVGAASAPASWRGSKGNAVVPLAGGEQPTSGEAAVGVVASNGGFRDARGSAAAPAAGWIPSAGASAITRVKAGARAETAGRRGSGGGGGGHGSSGRCECSEVACMRDLMSRGLTAAHINSLICTGTALADVVCALDNGVPLRLIACLLGAGLSFQVVVVLLHSSIHQSTRYWKLRPPNELFFRLPFATWHNGITYDFFGPFLTEWAAAGWSRDFIDRIFHANDPLAARLKAAYDQRGVPQRLPPPLMAAHDPLLRTTARRRLLLLRVFLAAWWLPQRWATAALLAAVWAAELGCRRLLRMRGPAAALGWLRPALGQLVPRDAVAEMLPVYGITRVGRAGLLQGLIKVGVPSHWYGLELPRAVVAVHWEGYARDLFAMQGLEHMLLMGLHGIVLWALRTAFADTTVPEQQQQLPTPPDGYGGAETLGAPSSSGSGGGGGADGGSNASGGTGGDDAWPLRSPRLALPLLLLSWATAAGLVLEVLRARANGWAAYRSHQANWVRVASSCLTLATLVVLLSAGTSSSSSSSSGGDVYHDDRVGAATEGPGGAEGEDGEDALWRRALKVALALGSVQVLLLCYQLLLFSGLSDGMGSLVRMVVEVVKSMGYFFLMLAIVFGGFAAAFVVLMSSSLDVPYFMMRLFTVMLGDFSVAELHSELTDGTFLAPALSAVLMAAYGVVLIIVLVNLLIAIMTDAYARVRSSEVAEVTRNKAYIINAVQLGLPPGLAGQIEDVLLGPYLHLLTVTAVDSTAAAAAPEQQRRRRRHSSSSGLADR